MKRLSILALIAASIVLVRVGAGSDEHRHGHEVEHQEEERGPHGGRLLRDGERALEITIYERGGPPELRVYPSRAGRPIPPAGVELAVELERLGGRVDRLSFEAAGDYLRSREVVEEPHSFDVRVRARIDGHVSSWSDSTYEGRVELEDGVATRSGIEIATAGPAKIERRLKLYGRIGPDEDRLAHVVPRFPGVIRDLRKRLGDPVAKGELLAVVESNESLRPFEIASPLDGTVVAKSGTVGELATDEAIYVVADLRRVWLDLSVPRADFPSLAVGQPLFLSLGDETVEARIDFLSPLGTPATQSLLARSFVPNPEGRVRPGLFATADAVVEEATVPVAVAAEALQTVREWTVVFRAVGNVFEAQPVEVGRSSGRWAEIRSGLSPGERYVARGSYLLKAEIGKSEASHDH